MDFKNGNVGITALLTGIPVLNGVHAGYALIYDRNNANNPGPQA